MKELSLGKTPEAHSSSRKSKKNHYKNSVSNLRAVLLASHIFMYISRQL